MSSASDWNKRIGAYAQAQREGCSDVDRDLQSTATSGYYGYEDKDSAGGFGYNRDEIYQGYDDERSRQGQLVNSKIQEEHSDVTATERHKLVDHLLTDNEVHRKRPKRKTFLDIVRKGFSAAGKHLPEFAEYFAIREAGSNQNEGKDSYDAIDLDSTSDDDGNHKKWDDKEGPPEDNPITKKLIIELVVCIMAFIGRGLCLNSVGPTLIDLRQIASMSVPEAAWIFVSQSIGFLIGSVLAKVILQRCNNELALGVSLSIQAVCSAMIPAFKSKVVMCLMFVGQGYAIGVVGIGVCSTCIRLGGKTRNGMFLQAVYLGVSLGSVLGPFIARPFLSTLAKEQDNHQEADTLGSYIGDKLDGSYSLNDQNVLQDIAVTKPPIINITSPVFHFNATTAEFVNATTTHVHFYYVIMALILSIPALSFFMLYIKRDKSNQRHKQDTSKSESLAFKDCTLALVSAIGLIFVQCLLYFGIQDTYSNLLTTFAVLGPLQLTKTKGVYLTSLFWASMAFGRLNGIWIAKLISPFKILLIDMSLATVASFVLMSFGGKYSGVLWGFTVILGLSFATINGATVSWAAQHLPENNYILSIIMIGRCVGLLLLPTTVTALFKICGHMTLMYAVFSTTILMLVTLLAAQTIATRFGVDGRLHGTSVSKADDTEHDDI